jgi:hypothetical protein
LPFDVADGSLFTYTYISCLLILVLNFVSVMSN